MATPNNLTDRQRAAFGPRDMKPVGSPEWCYQTLTYLKSRWEAHQFDAKIFSDVLAEVKAARAWEKVPPDNPYGSLNSLLIAELGVEESEVERRLTNKEKARQGALRTTGEVLPSDGRVNQHTEASQFTKPQGQRATENGIGKRTQEKLDWLAAKRSDLHERIKAGELSVNAAWIEAGRGVAVFNCPKDVPRAAGALRRHFTPTQIRLLACLLLPGVEDERGP